MKLKRVTTHEGSVISLRYTRFTGEQLRNSVLFDTGRPLDQPVHVQQRDAQHHHARRPVHARGDMPRLSFVLAARRFVSLLQSALARHHPPLARHPRIAPVSRYPSLLYCSFFYSFMRFSPVFLHSGSDPVRIKSPPELADQTVEERLITFDWEKNFHTFQEATRKGAFRPLCWGKTQALIDVSALPYIGKSGLRQCTETAERVIWRDCRARRRRITSPRTSLNRAAGPLIRPFACRAPHCCRRGRQGRCPSRPRTASRPLLPRPLPCSATVRQQQPPGRRPRPPLRRLSAGR